jgi:hypothetical protein
LRVGSYVSIPGLFSDDDWERGIVVELTETNAYIAITGMPPSRNFEGQSRYWMPREVLEVISE